MEATRERGYAVLLDVVVERMGGIAIALPDADGYPLGAISMAALNERITEREPALARALRREAETICATWRGHAPVPTAGAARVADKADEPARAPARGSGTASAATHLSATRTRTARPAPGRPASHIEEV